MADSCLSHSHESAWSLRAADGAQKREELQKGTASEAASAIVRQLDSLRTARPTAVNLFRAIDDLSALVTAVRHHLRVKRARPIGRRCVHVAASNRKRMVDLDGGASLLCCIGRY